MPKNMKKYSTKNYNFLSIQVRSLAFNIFLPIWTVINSTILSPLIIFKNPKLMSLLGISWSYVVIYVLKILCKIQINVLGEQNLPESPFIIACKHQSTLETAFFQQYLKFPVYVIKKELLKIPFYGWFLKYMGMIPVDRNGDIASFRQMLRNCQINIQQKRTIIIFPEGTRVKPFESTKYHEGITAIKKKFPNIPIIPIALNSGLFWPKNSWLKYPGIMTFKILPRLDENIKNKEITIKLKEIIDSNSDNLCSDLLNTRKK